MKHFLLSICLFICFNLSAQKINQNTKKQVEYTCDQMNYDAESNIIEMIGSVNMKTEKLEIKNASKITYNKETNEIKANGNGSFTFDGTIIINDSIEVKTIRYVLGEDVAYIE